MNFKALLLATTVALTGFAAAPAEAVVFGNANPGGPDVVLNNSPAQTEREVGQAFGADHLYREIQRQRALGYDTTHLERQLDRQNCAIGQGGGDIAAGYNAIMGAFAGVEGIDPCF